jgi:hypothetical protein
MGLSFSRVHPTRPKGERRAGRVVQVGQWSIVTVGSYVPRGPTEQLPCIGQFMTDAVRVVHVRLENSSKRAEWGAGQDVSAEGSSPLIPNVAGTMARVLMPVKWRQKKIGAD